jgi:hypothetical protein
VKNLSKNSMGAAPVQEKFLPFLAKCQTFSEKVLKIQLNSGPQGKPLVSCSTLELFFLLSRLI